MWHQQQIRRTRHSCLLRSAWSKCPSVQRSQTLKSTFSNIHKVKAPSRFARIFLRWAGFKQEPMEASASFILLWKRSLSLAISSQFPLRDACRANSQDRMTWTWITGENLTWNQKRSQVAWHTKTHKTINTQKRLFSMSVIEAVWPRERKVLQKGGGSGTDHLLDSTGLYRKCSKEMRLWWLNSHVTQRSHQLHRQH